MAAANPNQVIIAIPSKARAERVQKAALSWLAFSKFRENIRVFIEPQDEESYSERIAAEHLMILPDNDRGLGYAMNCIGKWARNGGYDVIIRLDDDIKGFAKRKNQSTPQKSAQWFDEAVDKSLKAFAKYPQLGAVGFPYRFELYDPKEWSAINARLQTAYICKTEYWGSDERIGNYFDDFYTYINIRAKGAMTLRYGLIGIDNDVGGAAGGCQVNPRQVEGAKNAITVMRELYPALKARKVDKPWAYEPSLKGEFFGVKSL